MAALKIVCVGPESSGKTTLTLALAAHFGVPYVLEYARGYLESGKQINCATDLTILAQKQQQAENDVIITSEHKAIFCDTDLHNILVWSELAFNHVNERLKKLEKQQHYDLYLLLRPDIPWQNDSLRQNAHLRDKLFNIYEQRLIETKRNFIEIYGDRIKRFNLAANRCYSLFGSYI